MTGAVVEGQADDAWLAAVESEAVKLQQECRAVRRKRHASNEAERRRVDPETNFLAQQRYRQRHPEELSKKGKMHRDRVKADPVLNARRLALKNASQRRRRALKKTGQKVVVGPSLAWRVQQDDRYAACSAVVPKGVPPNIREDVIADLVVAVLEGDFKQSEVAAHASRFLRAYDYRFKESSLDAPIPGTEGKVTYLDRLAAPATEPWLEAAE